MDKVRQLLKTVEQLPEVWTTLVVMPNKDNSKLLPAEGLSVPPGWEGIYNILDTSTISGTTFLTQKTQIVQHQHIKQPSGAAVSHPLSAVAMIPILKNGKSVGVLEILKNKADAEFLPEDIIYFEKIANQLSRFI